MKFELTKQMEQQAEFQKRMLESKNFLNLPYIEDLGMIILLENEKKNLQRTRMKKKLRENENEVCSHEGFFC